MKKTNQRSVLPTITAPPNRGQLSWSAMTGQAHIAGRQERMTAMVPRIGINQNSSPGSTRNGANRTSEIGGWMNVRSLNANGPATSWAMYGLPVSTQRRVAST